MFTFVKLNVRKKVVAILFSIGDNNNHGF